ncbi:MAG: hypothetical protein M3296_03730, partial [Actinomycetota bacterium]|nr:hypothetical protein [Actinomycetota bacterium]
MFVSHLAPVAGPPTDRDLSNVELWELSLERSRRRRELAEDARRTISRRRQASLAVSAAMATTPVIPSVIASG